MTPRRFYLCVIILASTHIYIILKYKHAIAELDGWSTDSNRNVSSYLEQTVRTLPDNFCRYPTTLLILVHSTPSNHKARSSIRRTWGNVTKLSENNASLFFLLGENRRLTNKILTMEENSKYGDLIVENFIDDYANLTLKSMVMVKLFQKQTKCHYLLKTDEDIFTNVKNVVSYVRSRKSNHPLLVGRIINGERRKNNPRKKWYAPRYMYHRHVYPSFLAGPAYLMSRDVAQKLYRTGLREPFFHLEDVFLTGICAEKAGIERQYNDKFTDFDIPKNKCQLVDLFTAHSFNHRNMFFVHKLKEDIVVECKKKKHPSLQKKNSHLLPFFT